MCIDTVTIVAGRQTRCDTRAQLAAALGIADHLALPALPDAAHAFEPGECLCHVDLARLAEARSMRVIWGAWGTRYECDVVMDDLMPASE